MRERRRMWIFLVVTAVFLSGIHSLAQAQQAKMEIAGPDPITYIPAIFTPDCEEYFDDFSNPGSGWTVGDNAIVTYAYINDEYSIASKMGGLVLGSVAPLNARENYVVEVEAHYNAPPTDGFYALIFGVKREGVNNSISEYYLFEVEPDGQEYGLYYRDPSAAFHPIFPPATSGAINMGPAVNTLTAVRDSNQITLKINDTTLGTWTDARITGDTQVGLAMWADPDNPMADARFDNFTSHICTLAELGGSFQARRIQTPNYHRNPSSATVQDAFSSLNE